MNLWNSTANIKDRQTVLIVSQDSKMAAAWKALFKQKNCHVIHETLPSHALRTARSASPALVILDLDLTQPERLALCKQLRPMTAGAIFLLVPHTDKNDDIEYYYAGVDEHLASTISPAALLTKATLWLRIAPREKPAQVYA